MKLSEQVASLEDERDRLWEVTEDLVSRLDDALFSLGHEWNGIEKLYLASSARDLNLIRKVLGFYVST